MQRSTFLLLAILAATPALARDYALVLIGRSHPNDAGRHDYGRMGAAVSLGLKDKSYETVTLFGAEKDIGTERESFKADYDFYASKKLVGGDESAATPKNVDAYFADLLKKVAKGDRVKLFVAAHGNQTCPEGADASDPDDRRTRCTHFFALYGPDGKSIRYESTRLLEWVRRLEEAGAVVDLVLKSCHSGRARPLAKRLANACVYFSSSGNGVSYSCMEHDFDADPKAVDFTGTAEAVAYHFYAHVAPKLAEEEYFKKSRCFAKLAAHVAARKMDFSSIHDAHWSGRRWDETYGEGGLSAQLKYAYFGRDHVASPLAHTADLSPKDAGPLDKRALADVATDIDEIVAGRAKGKEAAAIAEALAPLRVALATTVVHYNDSVDAQKKLLAVAPGDRPDDFLDRVAAEQEATRSRARAVIAAERALVDRARVLAGDLFAERDSACRRRL